VSDWLDLMLEEIGRKRRESKEAEDEIERRNKDDDSAPSKSSDQSK